MLKLWNITCVLTVVRAIVEKVTSYFPDASKLLIADTLVNFARGCFVLILGLYLYSETSSIWAFAAAFISDFVIAIFIQGLAGRKVDKYGARRILIIASLVCAFVFIPLTIVVTQGDNSPYLWVMMLSLVHNATRPFLRSALFAAVPAIAPEGETQVLNARLVISLQVGQIAGGILAGLGLEWFSYEVIFSTLGIVYLVAGSLYWFIQDYDIKKDQDKKRKENGLLATFIHLFRTEKSFMCFAVIGAIDFALVGLLALFVAPTIEHLFDGQTRWLLFIELAFAFGAILAGGMTTRFKIEVRHNCQITAASCLVAAGVFYEMSTLTHSAILLPLICLMGFFTSWSSVVWVTLLQKIAPKEYMGSLGGIRLCFNASMLGCVAIFVSVASDVSFRFGASVALFLGLTGIFLAFKLNKINMQRTGL